MAEPETNTSPAAPAPGASPWSPFRHATFSILWTATVVANVGTWMYNAAAGWLITTLTPEPQIVSLVQVATSIPMFLFALPAGALADILDKRRLLLTVVAGLMAVSTTIAALVSLKLVSPSVLLFFTFLLGTGAALTAPAWQAMVPALVPRQNLAPAVAANSVGVNISRAVGPALGGALIAGFGVAMPFWLNALSNIGILAALMWWRPPPRPAGHLPAERFTGALRAGFRHARHNPHLHATLIRAVAFFLFASAYWALLPLVARDRITGGPGLYGFMLGAIGAGAIGGAFILPWLRLRLGPDRVVAAGTIGTAIALVLFGLAREPVTGLTASAMAGVSWIWVLASFNVSAQVALPDWVRGRGLAMFVTVFFGAISVGSALWGQVAGLIGLSATHLAAATGALAMIPLTWRWKLQTGAGHDFTASMHWPAPVIDRDIVPDQGPVLVTVEYRVKSEHRDAFVDALETLGRERRRDGAYAWGLFEDAAKDGRFIETFLVESWLEHLRQHDRVTEADRALQSMVHSHLDGAPAVTHYVAAGPR
ncbi:MAG: MFS transporter [Alphaproteobacteria bacterium]|nr:MFS transporter [Alphaproteobacteria bacterium]